MPLAGFACTRSVEVACRQLAQNVFFIEKMAVFVSQ
jgi:hypothetical protein